MSRGKTERHARAKAKHGGRNNARLNAHEKATLRDKSREAIKRALRTVRGAKDLRD